MARKINVQFALCVFLSFHLFGIPVYTVRYMLDVPGGVGHTGLLSKKNSPPFFCGACRRHLRKTLQTQRCCASGAMPPEEMPTTTKQGTEKFSNTVNQKGFSLQLLLVAIVTETAKNRPPPFSLFSRSITWVLKTLENSTRSRYLPKTSTG